MSRIGKIARLPKAVREELNRRLEDGEQQNRLVEWLNGRVEVQAVLKAEFDSRPINEPNLTAWAQGGYEDWRREQESLEAADRVVEESAQLDAMCEGQGMADRAAMMAALAIGEQFMAIRRMEDGAEKRKAVLKLVRGLVRLRNSDRAYERGQREAARAERAGEIHEDWAEGARRRRQTEHPPSPRLGRAGGEPRAEHECGGATDVRARMVEIVARMSDAEIAESLRRSGYTGEQTRPSFAEASAGRPAERVSWMDEDEALDGTEPAEEDAESDEEDDSDGADDGTAAPTSSRLRRGFGGQDGGQASKSAGGPDKAPPAVQIDPASGGLREA